MSELAENEDERESESEIEIGKRRRRTEREREREGTHARTSRRSRRCLCRSGDDGNTRLQHNAAVQLT